MKVIISSDTAHTYISANRHDPESDEYKKALEVFNNKKKENSYVVLLFSFHYFTEGYWIETREGNYDTEIILLKHITA